MLLLSLILLLLLPLSAAATADADVLAFDHSSIYPMEGVTSAWISNIQIVTFNNELASTLIKKTSFTPTLF